MSPDETLDIDCYVDADFAGLWGVENPESPISVKSRSGWVIMVGGCPVIWASKMQTETALSTMQAEYVALSSAMRDLLPFKALMTEIVSNMGLLRNFILRKTVFSKITWKKTYDRKPSVAYCY